MLRDAILRLEKQASDLIALRRSWKVVVLDDPNDHNDVSDNGSVATPSMVLASQRHRNLIFSRSEKVPFRKEERIPLLRR